MSNLEVSGQVPTIPQQQSQQQAQQPAFDQGVQQYQQPPQFQYQAPPVQQPLQQPLQQPVQPVQQPVQQPFAQQEPVPAVKQPKEPTQNYSGNDPLAVGVQIFTRSAGIDEAAFYDALAPALQYGDPNLINLLSLLVHRLC